MSWLPGIQTVSFFYYESSLNSRIEAVFLKSLSSKYSCNPVQLKSFVNGVSSEMIHRSESFSAWGNHYNSPGQLLAKVSRCLL